MSILAFFLRKNITDNYPDAVFRIEDYYSKDYIDKQYESGNWNEWC